MKKLSSFLFSKSNLVVCISLTVIMVLYASLILGSQGKCITEELSGEQSLLGLQFGYNHDDVQDLFTSVDKNALVCYADLLKYWDNIFPAIYCLMYIFWLSLIYRSVRIKSKPLVLINLFPILPAILDWTENFFELRLINTFIDYSQIISSDVQTASIVTQLKWTFSSINYLIILTGLFLLIRHKVIIGNK